MELPLKIAKALGDGSRMRVVVALMRCDELCVCQIVEMVNLSTASVFRHMSFLLNARLVKNRKDGRRVYYRLAEPFSKHLRTWLFNRCPILRKSLRIRHFWKRFCHASPRICVGSRNKKKACND